MAGRPPTTTKMGFAVLERCYGLWPLLVKIINCVLLVVEFDTVRGLTVWGAEVDQKPTHKAVRQPRQA